MWKTGGFDAESVYKSMQEALANISKSETNYGFDKIAKAADLLNTAASIFDEAGMQKEADQITAILQSIIGEER